MRNTAYPHACSWYYRHPNGPQMAVVACDRSYWLWRKSMACIAKTLTHCGLVTPLGDRFGSTLTQVMAWCLTAPSHYLNQCWLISKVLWHSPDSNYTMVSTVYMRIRYQNNRFGNYMYVISVWWPRFVKFSMRLPISTNGGLKSVLHWTI